MPANLFRVDGFLEKPLVSLLRCSLTWRILMIRLRTLLISCFALGVEISPSAGIVRVSVSSSGTEANGDASHDTAWDLGITSDGRYIVFVDAAYNLVTDGSLGTDVFIHDRDPAPSNGIFDEGYGDTYRVSVHDDGSECQAAGQVYTACAISDDARFTAFPSFISYNCFNGYESRDV